MNMGSIYSTMGSIYSKENSLPANTSVAEPSANGSCHRRREADADALAVGASKSASNGIPNIVMTPRENDFNEKTWWMVDLTPIGESSSQGASALVKRCMRTYRWDEAKARKVLDAYRQFIILKKELEDWDAKILSPCNLVDQMWHCHILDVVNYCHDMMLLCGHVVGHNPDGALDSAAKQKRDETTRKSLQQHFGSYDEEVWDAPPQPDKITIRVGDQSGEEIGFVIERSIQMVKVFEAYAAKVGRDVSDLCFQLDGERFDPYDTAVSLDLEDDDQIDCFIAHPPADTMQIVIINLTGKITTLSVRPTDTVFSIKETMQEMEGFPPAEEQRLIFAGKQIEDGRTLMDYNITEGTTIHLIKKIRGC